MKSIHLSIPVKITLVFAFLFLVITYVSTQIKYNDLIEEKSAIEAKIETVQNNIDALQNKLNTPFDDDYIVTLAKNKLNYCLPDEIIFYNDLTK